LISTVFDLERNLPTRSSGVFLVIASMGSIVLGTFKTGIERTFKNLWFL